VTARPDRGFTLIELLVASLVACALLGVLLRVVVMAERQTHMLAAAGDVQQRIRVAADRIRADLVMAGAGPSDAAWPAPLSSFVPAVVPARTGSRGADPPLTYASDRISLMRAAEPSSDTVLVAAMAGVASALAIDTAAPPCGGQADCGFAAGDRVLVVDPADPALPFEVLTVADAAAGLVVPARALARPYARGSRVMKIVERTYRLDRSTARLMLYDGDASDVPLVDHLVDLRFSYYVDPSAASVPPARSGGDTCVHAAGTPPPSRLSELGGLMPRLADATLLTDGPVCGIGARQYDADLLRVRRIRVTLRVEAEAAIHRAGGARFASPGTSAGGIDEVADQQITFDVAPRNLNLAR
jgi:prepilin-type N-terminal cleavage/methylation domain-containing protein